MEADKEFIYIFNEYYPFERYIIKNPQKINYLFDDALLTEIFIPDTEIKPIVEDGKIKYWTKINKDEIYIKIKGSAGEMRFARQLLRDEYIRTYCRDNSIKLLEISYKSSKEEIENLIKSL